jgi:hypothetical protein
MFSSNITKFFVLAALSVLLFSGCRWSAGSNDANQGAAPPVAEDFKSEIPFSTREPERFQAEIVVTANGAERKTFVARGGASQRYDFNFGAKNQVTALSTDKSYLLAAAHKIYAENAAGTDAATPDDWTAFLTTEWLNQKRDAKFEKLETAANLTKYRVLMDESAATEAFIYIDEALGLPVKQELYAVGEQTAPVYAFELKNVKLEADADLFIVPPDYRRVSTEEFWKIVRSDKN